MWAPNLLWKLFDMFIGGIQAFIFALLTVLYFGMAGSRARRPRRGARGRDRRDPDEESADESADEDTDRGEPALAH